MYSAVLKWATWWSHTGGTLRTVSIRMYRKTRGTCAIRVDRIYNRQIMKIGHVMRDELRERDPHVLPTAVCCSSTRVFRISYLNATAVEFMSLVYVMCCLQYPRSHFQEERKIFQKCISRNVNGVFTTVLLLICDVHEQFRRVITLHILQYVASDDALHAGPITHVSCLYQYIQQCL